MTVQSGVKSILLADDHALLRDTLVQYIETHCSDMNVRAARDFYEVEQILTRTPNYHLVMIDMFVPGMEQMHGVSAMRRKWPEIPVAVMSSLPNDDDLKQAMKLGASGYFPKTMSGPSLLQAIKYVLDGEFFVPVSYETRSRQMHTSPPQEPVLIGEEIKLTPRETEVLGYLVKGASNKEIAIALDLQVVTVKLHVRGICQKLKAKNRTQAALKARKYNLLNKNSMH